MAQVKGLGRMEKGAKYSNKKVSDGRFFSREDSGCYKQNPLRLKVIESLRAKPYQSMRHLVESTNLSIGEISSIVEGGEEIGYTLVGEITVYHLADNPPSGRLFNTGKNSFAIVAGTETQAKDKRNVVRAAPTQSKLDLKLLEQFGREGRTIKEIAAALDIKVSSVSFYLYSKDYPQYGEAFRRGKKNKKNDGVIIFPQETLTDDEIETAVIFLKDLRP